MNDDTSDIKEEGAAKGIQDAIFDGISNEYSANYKSNNTLKNIYFERRLELIKKTAVHIGPKKVLDLGCGSGEISEAIAKACPNTQITLIDESQCMLNKAKRKLSAENIDHKAYLGDLEKEMHPGKYDFVIVAGVLAYIENINALARTCKNSAKNNKTLVAVQITNHSHILHKLARFAYNLRNGHGKSDLHYMRLKQWRITDVDQAMYKQSFEKVVENKFSFDLPGLMGAKMPRAIKKAMKLVDWFAGTDRLMIYMLKDRQSTESC